MDNGEKLKELFCGRKFKEKYANELIDYYPEIKDYFIDNKTINEIKVLTGFLEKYNLTDGKNASEFFTMALGGYTNTKNQFIEGLLPRNEYNLIMKEHYKKVLPNNIRSENAINGYEKRELKKGNIPYTDSHRYFVWFAIRNSEFLNNDGKVNRKKILEELIENPIKNKSLSENELNQILGKFSKKDRFTYPNNNFYEDDKEYFIFPKDNKWSNEEKKYLIELSCDEKFRNEDRFDIKGITFELNQKFGNNRDSKYVGKLVNKYNK